MRGLGLFLFSFSISAQAQVASAPMAEVRAFAQGLVKVYEPTGDTFTVIAQKPGPELFKECSAGGKQKVTEIARKGMYYQLSCADKSIWVEKTRYLTMASVNADCVEKVVSPIGREVEVLASTMGAGGTKNACNKTNQ